MRRSTLLLASLLAALPAALAAQGVTGTVVDQQSGAPVPGAMVSLVASDGAARDVGDLVRTFPRLIVTEIPFPGTAVIKEICIRDRSAIQGGALSGGGGGGGGALGGPGSVPQGPNLSQLEGSVCKGAAVALDEVLIGGSAGEFLRTFPTTGIESVIYLKPTDATGRYGLAGANGVVLIYTRGNGPTVVREQ